MVRALETQPDRHLTGNEIDEAAGDEERRDAARAFFLQDKDFALDAFQPADARTGHDAGALALFFRLQIKPGVVKGHLRGRDAVDDELVHAPPLARFDPVVGIERSLSRRVAAAGTVSMRHLRRDVTGERGRIEFLDAPGAGFAVDQPAPYRIISRAQRADDSNSGDNNASHPKRLHAAYGVCAQQATPMLILACDANGAAGA